MKLLKSRILLASATSLLVLGACNSDHSAKPAAAVPAAKEAAEVTVNGIVISKKRVDMLVQQAAGNGQPDNPEARQGIVDKLIMQTVVAEEAVKKGLDKSPEVIEQIDLIRQSVLANAYVQDLIKTSTASDEVLKAEYEKIKATITGSEYKARHILVEKEADAKDIIARLRKDPGSFEKLAMEKSKDAGSKARGGELGWFDAGRMVPEFGAAVSKLEKGAITPEPVKTQYGYHVIQLEDAKPVEAPPFEEVKPHLAQQVQQQNVKKQLEELKAKARIEPAAAPAAPAAPAAAPVPATPAAPAVTK
ncbi:MAG: peptidylprolyl isomerase [Candidatus Accumulibacter sp.]|uniref:peptidylprolyl isomerase n=1 Tax=Candidatus Accumulibacter affinis TaxID=2954384 RepID=A0A935TA92_9PROT|nr:peptidylprolyl isomerase [Candidatus Accumulibacter affinis]MBP9806371.1 peptidylprolyl isomerase [Accumulibacter sp.]